MNAILDTSGLQKSHDDKWAKMVAMNELSATTGEPFNEAQQTEYDALDKSVTALGKQIETINGVNSRVATQLGNKGTVAPAAGNPRVAVVTSPGGTIPGQVTTKTNEGFKDDPKAGFRDMHEFLENVMNYGKQVQGRISGFKDERIEHLASLNVAQRTGFLNDCSDGSCDPGGSTTDLTGSVFVPVEYAPDMFKVKPMIPNGAFNTTRRTTRGLSIVKKYRLDKDHRESVTGGFQVGRNYEHCCNVSSAAKYSTYTVTVHPIYGAYCASDMLMDTNPQMIIQEVEDGFNTEFDSNRIIEILKGQGQGEYTGVWNSNCLIEIAPDSPGEVNKIDIYRMGERIWKGPKRQLVWIAGLNYESKLKTMQDTTTSTKNHFLFDPNSGPDWADGMLDGKPIVFTEYVPGFGFRGSLGLYNFAEFEEYTWKPMRFASSMHAKFMCNETVMKFWTYTGGQSRWDSSLIPKAIPEGEDVDDHTLSPFVLLGGTANNAPKLPRPHKKTPAA